MGRLMVSKIFTQKTASGYPFKHSLLSSLFFMALNNNKKQYSSKQKCPVCKESVQIV